MNLVNRRQLLRFIALFKLFQCYIDAIICAQFSTETHEKLPIACSKEGQIALTFDGGPSYYTGNLLNILSKESVKAAFHITADYFDNPVIMAYLRRAVQEGHLIGLHVPSLLIPELQGPSNNIVNYVRKVGSRLTKYTGVHVKYLRFPASGPSKDQLTLLKEAGFIVTHYNLDSNDFGFKGEGSSAGSAKVFNVFKNALNMIVEPAKGAFISVQRDLLDYSVNATDLVIKYGKKKGYSFVRLDQCISLANENHKKRSPGKHDEFTSTDNSQINEHELDNSGDISINGFSVSTATLLIISSILHVMFLFLI